MCSTSTAQYSIILSNSELISFDSQDFFASERQARFSFVDNGDALKMFPFSPDVVPIITHHHPSPPMHEFAVLIDLAPSCCWLVGLGR
ncbi:predicted protein [Sclerotinia sclerotiorum 1980 UF-70]|uniref:Uncharacterized protein n=1 Tax=Sclerotinia sclerotiorum (strain ATCC 18683 / 1980 / Ss-1) TaxID=665079 RepID=A7F1X4_SCLS1|nr:predicted protein [Sclerotinia sclerotiorum 1980 UF-70]EDN95716.1 predicted protein [Sclerotinia sclerotiorum 1980 UF-70]